MTDKGKTKWRESNKEVNLCQGGVQLLIFSCSSRCQNVNGFWQVTPRQQFFPTHTTITATAMRCVFLLACLCAFVAGHVRLEFRPDQNLTVRNANTPTSHGVFSASIDGCGGVEIFGANGINEVKFRCFIQKKWILFSTNFKFASVIHNCSVLLFRKKIFLRRLISAIVGPIRATVVVQKMRATQSLKIRHFVLTWTVDRGWHSCFSDLQLRHWPQWWPR